MLGALIVRVQPSTARLVLPVDLQEPSIERVKFPVIDPELDYSEAAWSFHDVLGVRTTRNRPHGPFAEIFTILGVGGDQTKMFDKLVGQELAELREALDRETRKLLLENWMGFEQRVEVSLDTAQIDRILTLIAGHAEDTSPDQSFLVPGYTSGDLNPIRVNYGALV